MQGHWIHRHIPLMRQGSRRYVYSATDQYMAYRTWGSSQWLQQPMVTYLGEPASSPDVHLPYCCQHRLSGSMQTLPHRCHALTILL